MNEWIDIYLPAGLDGVEIVAGGEGAGEEPHLGEAELF